MTDALPKRTRDQLDRMAAAFDAIDALVHRVGLQGLQRMSRASVDELAALGQTAHNAGLVRIERDLARLATHLGRALDRDPLFDVEVFGDALNRVWLTNRRARARVEAGALPDEMLDLIGRARRSYSDHDPLELQALGASGWVSDSGFVGVSIDYATADGRRIEAASARPTMYFGTDPTRLMRFAPHDTLDVTLGELAHGAWRFDAVRLSDDGRLSIHKELRVGPAPFRGGRAYDPWRIDRWRDAVDRLRAAELGPLGSDARTPVYIEPAAVEPVVTDETRARATAVARDEGGARLAIEVALRFENNLLVDNLERLFGPHRGEDRAPPCDGIWGHLEVEGDRLLVRPITGVWRRPIQLARRRGLHHTAHLSLESLEGARLV